ncbi:MAG: glycosyltransferase [Desulfohalobiaceae bacterium]|nr:glycosyltransferase [Desulfohalobiaceae bacterium]
MDSLYEKTSYHVSELTELSEQEFIRAGYLAVLKREPDPAGFAYYLDVMQKKQMSKKEILGRLRYSPEGKERRVRIRGLSLPYAFYRIAGKPMIRPWVQFIRMALNLPRLWDDFYDFKERLDHLPRAFEQEVGSGFPDHIYWDLEEAFRGSTADLEAGLLQYIPLVRDCLSEGEQVLDLGSGRGEWLGLLRKQNLFGKGVDHSQAMVEACRMRGFEVEQADILSCLEGLADNSVPVLTAFHVMEHLSPSILVRIWEEAYRVLRPGGMLLFETPNPENMQVSTYYFYCDPTHKKPVPPPVATYTLNALGFTAIRIIRSKPLEPPIFGQSRLDGFFSAAMEYAVIGYKQGLPEEPIAEHIQDPPLTAEAPDLSRGLIINGPYAGSYSLALVNREMALALNEDYPGRIGLCFEDVQSEESRQDTESPLGDPSLSALCEQRRELTRPAAVLYNSYPPHVQSVPGALTLTNAYGWEESFFPREYVQGFNDRLQGMTLMSGYVLKTMQDNGVGLPMQVVGLGVDHIHRVRPDPCRLALGRGFRFLHVSSCFPRKGLDVLLQAYGRAFTVRDEVVLVVKTFPNPHNDARAQIETFSQDPEAPEVILIDEDISQARLLDLYRRSHCLVAPSRGEGFGLPMAEAMDLGLPVITTAYGGQADFCTPENAWLIKYTFQKARSHLSGFGSVWAEPDAGHLAGLLKEVYQADHVELRARTESAQQLVRSELTWKAASRKLSTFLGKLSHIEKKETIKVGWVSSWNCRCGIAEYSKYLLDQLEADFEILVFAPEGAEKLERDAPNVRRLWSFDSLQERLLPAVHQAGLDCVVVNVHAAFFALAELQALLQGLFDQKRQVILIFHSLQSLEEADPEALRLLGRVDRVLVHSIHDLNRMKDLGLVDNVTLFPHGVTEMQDLSGESCVALPPGFASRRIIASSGFLMPHKGIQELIQAFAELLQADASLGLLLVNAVYPREADLSFYHACQRLIRELNLEAAVHLVPDFLSLEDSLSLLSKAELIVYPYQHTAESSSAAVRMGLAADRPVACTPLSIFDDVAEVVHFLPGSRPDDLAEGLSRLLNDARCLQARDAIRREWLVHNAWSSVSARLSGLIRSLVLSA